MPLLVSTLEKRVRAQGSRYNSVPLRHGDNCQIEITSVVKEMELHGPYSLRSIVECLLKTHFVVNCLLL